MLKKAEGRRQMAEGENFAPESRSRGVIMVLAMFVMLVVAALVLGILQLRATEIQTLGNKMRQAASQYLADAGIEQAIWYLRLYKQPTWEWGDPNYTGVVTNDAAGSATGKVWGTSLNGNYPNGIFYQEKLVTPEITVTSTNPNVCYCDYLNNNADADDEVQMVFTIDGGKTWSSMNPAYVEANRNDAANTWTRRARGLTAVSGAKIRVAFILYTDGNLNDPGWYIDNLGITPTTVTCTPAALPCATVPASYDFYDNMENGIGNWEYWIEPNLSASKPSVSATAFDAATFPNDYPANSGNYYWIGFDPRFAASNEWIILGRGIYGTNSGKVEAKVQIVGGSSPYTVKILYWKRIM